MKRFPLAETDAMIHHMNWKKKILLLLMCILPMITFLPLKKLKYSEGRDDN